MSNAPAAPRLTAIEIPPKEDCDKSVNAGISLRASLISQGKEQANIRFGGRWAAYIAWLIEQDLAKNPARTAAIEKLTPEERDLLGIPKGKIGPA